MRSGRAWLLLAVFAIAAGCAKPRVVSTSEEALRIARTSLSDTEGRAAHVTQRDGFWEVVFDPRPGDPSRGQAIVRVKAKDGKVASYTDDVTDVSLIKPVK